MLVSANKPDFLDQVFLLLLYVLAISRDVIFFFLTLHTHHGYSAVGHLLGVPPATILEVELWIQFFNY